MMMLGMLLFLGKRTGIEADEVMDAGCRSVRERRVHSMLHVQGGRPELSVALESRRWR